jgi:hypothetical protein
MNKRPLSVAVALAFVILNLLVWLGLGILVAVNAHPALPDSPLVRGVMSAGSFVIAGVILVLMILLLYRHSRAAYHLTIAFFVFTSLLNFFDDFGLVDLVALVINILPVILLLKDRTWYLSGRQGEPTSQ